MTSKLRRKIISILVLALAGLSPLLPSTASAQISSAKTAAKPTVMVNITCGKEDLHAACMGIGLASNAIKAGRRSDIFLNVHAVPLAAADLPADLKFADFPAVKEMLASFVAEGGELYVCGHCAAVTKVAESNPI